MKLPALSPSLSIPAWDGPRSGVMSLAGAVPAHAFTCEDGEKVCSNTTQAWCCMTGQTCGASIGDCSGFVPPTC